MTTDSSLPVPQPRTEQEIREAVAQLRALAEACSPGEWTAATEPTKLPPQATHGYMIRTSEPEWPGPACVRLSSDAAFIAAAHNLVPSLLAALVAAQADKAWSDGQAKAARSEALRQRAERDAARSALAAAKTREAELRTAVNRALSTHPYNQGCNEDHVTDETYCCTWHLLRRALAASGAVLEPEPPDQPCGHAEGTCACYLFEPPAAVELEPEKESE